MHFFSSVFLPWYLTIRQNKDIMPQLHLPRTLYDLLVNDFEDDFQAS